MITSKILKHFAFEKFWIIGLSDFEIALIVFCLRNLFSAFSCYSFWYGRISIWAFFQILLDVTCSYFLDPCAFYVDEEFCPFEISKFLIFLAFCVFLWTRLGWCLSWCISAWSNIASAKFAYGKLKDWTKQKLKNMLNRKYDKSPNIFIKTVYEDLSNISCLYIKKSTMNFHRIKNLAQI